MTRSPLLLVALLASAVVLARPLPAQDAGLPTVEIPAGRPPAPGGPVLRTTPRGGQPPVDLGREIDRDRGAAPRPSPPSSALDQRLDSLNRDLRDARDRQQEAIGDVPRGAPAIRQRQQRRSLRLYDDARQRLRDQLDR